MGLHRDVLKLLRSYESAKIDAKIEANYTVSGDSESTWDQIELSVLSRYLTWLNNELSRYPTSLSQDKQTLLSLPSGYHWMYPFLVTYRIG